MILYYNSQTKTLKLNYPNHWKKVWLTIYSDRGTKYHYNSNHIIIYKCIKLTCCAS